MAEIANHLIESLQKELNALEKHRGFWMLKHLVTRFPGAVGRREAVMAMGFPLTHCGYFEFNVMRLNDEMVDWQIFERGAGWEKQYSLRKK